MSQLKKGLLQNQHKNITKQKLNKDTHKRKNRR